MTVLLPPSEYAGLMCFAISFINMTAMNIRPEDDPIHTTVLRQATDLSNSTWIKYINKSLQHSY